MVEHPEHPKPGTVFQATLEYSSHEPKITYVAYKEIFVHEIIELNNECFFGQVVRQALGSQDLQRGFIPPAVSWVDGIAFYCTPFPDTDDLIKDKLAGKMHYSSVTFTRIPYQEKYDVKLLKDPLPVMLEKAENTPSFVTLAEFIKNVRIVWFT